MSSRPTPNYFGFADASEATNDELKMQHIPLDVQTKLKYGSRAAGASVVVGIKGSGKTDLRRHIAASDKTAVTLELDTSTKYFVLDANKLKLTSGRIKNVLAVQLLQTFADQRSRTGTRAQRTRQKLQNVATRTREIVGNIPAAIDLTLPIASLDLAELAATRHTTVINDAWESLVQGLADSLSPQRGYILIDDVEDVFPGIQANPDFLEGLVRAVVEINAKLGARLHVLLFVKHGIWRHWFENQREYDRVKAYIRHLSWNHMSLVELVARRIAWRHGIDPGAETTQALWAREFLFNRFEDFTLQFTSLCVNGPRDVIDLCNRCAELAGDRPIQIHDLDTVIATGMPSYSEEKHRQIRADFGDVYPDIERLVADVLGGSRAVMAYQELVALCEDKAFMDTNTSERYRKHRWFNRAPAEIASLLYEVGAVGIMDADRVVYVIDGPYRTFRGDETVRVHPALWSILAIVQL